MDNVDINPELPSQQPSGKSERGNGKCCRHQEPRGKMMCFDWLADIPAAPGEENDMVEVQFKNTRKGFFKNSAHIPLEIGDWVAVEASPGHDIGQVTLLGPLVTRRMCKANIKPGTPARRVFRKAKASDFETFEMAKAKENDTMIRARKIAEDLNLKMKIGDVEYQGDGNKAIFYYIADERVDFRQLIKVLADAFKVRIEMKQIGARQEAGRIGGIGPCGRPLCCASWMTSFQSVGTASARFQDISLNPQKLAGQCAKLKCCLNFEVDAYVEGVKKMPGKEIRLETSDATYYHFKHDVFKRLITYSTDKSVPANLVTISAERAFEVISLNRAGEKPMSLSGQESETASTSSHYADILGQDSISRFDKKKKKHKAKNQQRQQPDPEAPETAEKAAPADNNANESRRDRQASNQRRQNNRNGNRRNQTRVDKKGKKPDNQPDPKSD